MARVVLASAIDLAKVVAQPFTGAFVGAEWVEWLAVNGTGYGRTYFGIIAVPTTTAGTNQPFNVRLKPSNEVIARIWPYWGGYVYSMIQFGPGIYRDGGQGVEVQAGAGASWSGTLYYMEP